MMMDQRFSATRVYYPASDNCIYLYSYTQLPLKVIGIKIQMRVGILSLTGGLKYCRINLKQSRSISGDLRSLSLMLYAIIFQFLLLA